MKNTVDVWLRLISVFILLSMSCAVFAVTPTCSIYKGQVSINELMVASSGKSLISNQIELFNSGNVPASVWQTWQIKVYYKRLSSTYSYNKGNYTLSAGFTANGQFIYNNNKAMYMRNQNNYYVDFALVDASGNFIDYIAVEGQVQTVPSCMGSLNVVNATSATSVSVDIPRATDGGNWPVSVTTGSANTIGKTNVCNNSGNDLLVNISADNTNPLVNNTAVNYTVNVSNVSCIGSVGSIVLNVANISTSEFSGLTYTPSQGSTVQNATALQWAVGSLAANAKASLIISGKTINPGAIITTVSIVSTNSVLVNPSDQTSSFTINSSNFNDVNFDTNADKITEGTNTSYSAGIGVNLKPTSKITVYYTVSGTATANDTNLASSGNVTIDPNSQTDPIGITIDFNISNDSIYEPTKTIILTITSISSTDGSVRLDTSANVMTITLDDDDNNQTLFGEYQMDELLWTNSSGDAHDLSTYGKDATATGSSGLPNTDWTTPAISGAQGTCAYGHFNGASTNQYLSVGNINYGLGGQYTVSIAAWVRWTINPATGNSQAVIVSNNASTAANVGQFWLQHSSVSSNNDHFQFAVKTTSTPVAVNSVTTPVQNQWYHVVGVYDGETVSIYVNGNLEASTPLTGMITNDNSYPLTIGSWKYNTQNYRAFQGDIDEVYLYTGAPLTASDVSTLYTATHTCPLYNTGVVPTSFNCVEVSAVPSSNLYTKLANTAFNLDIVALNSNGNINASYVGNINKNVTFELVNGSGSTACANRTVLSSGLTQTVSFTSTNQGRHSVTVNPGNTAYADVRCRITDANQTPNVVSCSSDDFAIRPASFTIASSASADATGTSASATPVIKTGANFTITATSSQSGYSGTPAVNNNLIVPHAGAVQAGVLTGSLAAATGSGISTGSFSYSEVGYFAFAINGVYDVNFTSVDSANSDCTADFSNNLVNGKYGCKFANSTPSGYFGRFIPDHLVTSVQSNGSFAHSCSSFSYNGQTLSYGSSAHPMLSVTAYNSASPAAITKNYTGSFNRLTANQFTLTAPTTDALKKGLDNTNLLRLSATLGTPSLTDNSNGNLTLILGNDNFTYQREANAMVGPFSNAIAVTVASVTDSDSVTATTLPMTLTPAGENIYYGRINLSNANGSELSDLAIPMVAEYYNGYSFVTNAADLCSVATITITDPLTNDSLIPANTCIWDNGRLSGSAYCATTAPTGESYLEGSNLLTGNFNLYLKAPGVIGSLSVNAAVANWLQYNWKGSGLSSPASLATFGIYQGGKKVIFFRELY